MRTRYLLPLWCLLVLASLLPAQEPAGLPSVATLCEQLKTGDVKTREQAALQLGNRQEPQALDALFAVVGDPEPDVRRAVMRALQRAPESLRLSDAKIAFLNDPDTKIKAEFFDLYRNKLLDVRLIPSLAAYIKSKPPRGDSVAYTLAEIGTPAAADTLLELAKSPDAEFHRWVANYLTSKLGMRVKDAALALMQDPDAETRARAAEALGTFDFPEVRAALRAALADADPNVRVNAAASLAKLSDIQALPDITRIYKQAERGSGNKIIYALYGCSDPKLLPLLIEVMTGQNISPHSAAIQALGNIRDPKAVELLCASLQTADRDSIQNIYQALQTNRDRCAVKPLLTFLLAAGTETDALQMANLAKPRMLQPVAENPSSGPLVTNDRRGYYAAYLLAAYGAMAVPELAQAMQAPEPRHRMLAIAVCCRMRCIDSLAPLSAALRDPDERVSAMAARALGILGDSHALAALQAAAKDPRPAVRAQAAWALGQIRDTRALPTLTALLADTPDVKFMAANALGNLADLRAAPALLAASRGELDEETRVQVMRALAKSNDPAALEPLLQQLPNETATPPVTAFVTALGETKSTHAVPALLALARKGDGDAKLRLLAIQVLGKIKDELAVDTLLTLLDDKNAELRMPAALALASFPRTPVAQAILAHVRDHTLSPDALKVIASLGESALEPVLQALKEGDAAWQAQLATACLLESASPDRIPYVVKVNDPRLVNALLPLVAASGLEQPRGMIARSVYAPLATPATMPLLLEALKSGKDPSIIISALGQSGDPRALEPLLKLLETDYSYSTKIYVVGALGNLGQPQVADTLARCFAEGNLNMRVQAVNGLCKLKDPRAQAAIKQMLQELPANERWRIYPGLAAMHDAQSFDLIVQEFTAGRGKPGMSLPDAIATQEDPRAYTLLLQVLTDPSWAYFVRENALNALATREEPAVTEAMLGLLNDPNLMQPSNLTMASGLKVAAIRVLGKRTDKRIAKALLPLLAEGPLRERIAAAEALAGCDDPAVVPALITALDQFPGDARSTPAQSLKTRTGKDYGEDAALWREWAIGLLMMPYVGIL